MDFDNRKVYGDTSITDGIVTTVQSQFIYVGPSRSHPLEDVEYELPLIIPRRVKQFSSWECFQTFPETHSTFASQNHQHFA